MMARAAWLTIRRNLSLLRHRELRVKEAERRRAFEEFRRAYGQALSHQLNKNGRSSKRALVASLGFVEGIKIELALMKGLQLAGYEVAVVSWRDPWLARYYTLAGVETVYCWEDLVGRVDDAVMAEAFKGIHSLHELLTLTWEGIRVGRFAASTALRALRVGSLDLGEPKVRRVVLQRIKAGIAHAKAAKRLLVLAGPSVALFVDRGYTPQGELFDACLAAGVDALTWNTAHKSNSLMLKRYLSANKDEHPASLSPASWEAVQRMPWTPTHRRQLQRELRDNYVSGDWYGEAGTQFNTRLVEAGEIRERLGLDPRKKTAAIFPHILWDGTFFFGEDLFSSYEEWFVETVRAACANDRANWIIKVHPANLVKSVRDGIPGEPAEMLVLRKIIGSLPPHVVVIPPDSDINTYSLLQVIDYCVTVRGTIGIEAASCGIPVLTAGTGRYNHKGFTIDSDSRQTYLEKLRRIDELSALSATQHESAERFAYGLFVLRPLTLKSFTVEFQQDARASCLTQIHAITKEDWLDAPDLQAFARWVGDAGRLDFMVPVSGGGEVGHGASSDHHALV